jgi:hypothetical protein
MNSNTISIGSKAPPSRLQKTVRSNRPLDDHHPAGTDFDGVTLWQRDSVKVIGRSHKDILKPQSNDTLVRVQTYDAELPLCYLLRDEPTRIRVGFCVGFEKKHSANEFPYTNRQVWLVGVIEKAAILSYGRVN